MKPMLAYCGLRCDTCPIHLVTYEKDKKQQYKMRESIARKCFEYYGINLLPEEVTDCDGCKGETGRLFSGCLDCEIKKCAEQKKIECCAYCSEYICEILKHHFSLDPDAHNRLEKIRQTNKI